MIFSPVKVSVVLALGLLALAPPTPPAPPAQEVVPKTEAADIAATVATFGAVVRAQYAHGVRPAPRDAHPKGQGCVSGRFTVVSGLPADLRHGVFASARSYPVWIRFSNGSAIKQADNIGDGRGMAIKLMGVLGPKLIPDEKYTQDFVMINHPVFFSANVADYLVLARGIASNALLQAFKHLPVTAQIITAIQAHVVRDMFEERYFSMSPYAFGNHYMKFSTIPVRCPSAGLEPAWPATLPQDPNFLRERMTQRLHQSDVCYDLAIQLQTDAATQPVEDDTVLWSETAAPFVTVAHIVIPKQTFTSAAQQTFCEDLSFSPWHSLKDQRPVGGINRLRLVIYRAGSELRHSLDHAPMIEPTGNESFH